MPVFGSKKVVPVQEGVDDVHLPVKESIVNRVANDQHRHLIVLSTLFSSIHYSKTSQMFKIEKQKYFT